MKAVVAGLAVLGVALLLLLLLQQALRTLWAFGRASAPVPPAPPRADDALSGPVSATTSTSLDGEAREIVALRDEVDLALRAIAEVRFDFATGKIDAEDRDQLERRYQERVLLAMRALRRRGIEVDPKAALHG